MTKSLWKLCGLYRTCDLKNTSRIRLTSLPSRLRMFISKDVYYNLLKYCTLSLRQNTDVNMYLVSVASLATRAFIIGALFDLLSDPRPPSSVLPFVTLSKSLLLYGAMPWPWMGVELMFALTGGSTSIFLSTMPSYEILSSNCWFSD